MEWRMGRQRSFTVRPTTQPHTHGHSLHILCCVKRAWSISQLLLGRMSVCALNWLYAVVRPRYDAFVVVTVKRERLTGSTCAVATLRSLIHSIDLKSCFRLLPNGWPRVSMKSNGWAFRLRHMNVWRSLNFVLFDSWWTGPSTNST